MHGPLNVKQDVQYLQPTNQILRTWRTQQATGTSRTRAQSKIRHHLPGNLLQ